jgi:glucose-1-phosphate thymidylyltransferase
MNDKKRIVGVVLAAGKGTRMYPFSYTIPKVMIPFWGKPLLAYHIDEFIQSNVNDIVIICSNDNIQMIKEYFTDNYQDIKIDYAIQEQPLGTANAIESASEFIKNNMALIKFGDNISKASLTSTLINKYNGYSNGIMTLKK